MFELPIRQFLKRRMNHAVNEILSLNIEDLDLANKRARVRSKGRAVEWVFWQSGAALLLPRLLLGRTAGPVSA